MYQKSVEQVRACVVF